MAIDKIILLGKEGVTLVCPYYPLPIGCLIGWTLHKPVGQGESKDSTPKTGDSMDTAEVLP